MIALLTSCGRHDLLKETLDSLNGEGDLDIIIHEDSVDDSASTGCSLVAEDYFIQDFILTRGIGQHQSIEKFLRDNPRETFYLHLEDDWKFNLTYDWLAFSTKLMLTDEKVIKVLARDGSPHPCIHDKKLRWQYRNDPKFGILEPWSSADGILWHGFSWNPGVTRMDYLRKFMPFPKWEQDLAEKIYNAGYRVAELSPPVYTHIGDGRSTH